MNRLSKRILVSTPPFNSFFKFNSGCFAAVHQCVVKNFIAKRCRCDFIGWAAGRRLLTGAIPLLLDTGTFGCSVSLLARFAPL